MIGELKSYAEYKDSGVPWLGAIPAHWQIARSKRLFTPRKELARPDDLQLSATQAYGVIAQTEFERRSGHRVVKISMHLDKRRHVEEGDFVISMRSFQGGLERAWTSGAIRSSYVILKPAADVDVDYFRYLLKSQPYVRALQATADFIRDGQDLNFDNFCRVELPLISLDEQVLIGRFLDWCTGRIERVIRAKRRLIALVDEQRKAAIDRAITNGVNERVERRPAGISWVGDIPAHWAIASLRSHWEVVDCKHLTVPFVEHGVPLASVAQVRRFYVDLHGCKKTTTQRYLELIEGGRRPKRGDLIYCRNVSVGSCALVDTDVEFAMGQDVCLIRSRQQNQRFLNYVMHSSFMDHQLELLLVGSTFKRINVAQIKSLVVLVPPRAEQDAICEFLDRTLVAFDRAIARLEREVVLLREYGTRLVADVVTGKLDVREAAKHLPEVPTGDAATEPDADVDEAELDDEKTSA